MSRCIYIRCVTSQGHFVTFEVIPKACNAMIYDDDNGGDNNDDSNLQIGDYLSNT